MGKFRYVLRFPMEPGFNEDEVSQRLVDFCKSGKIDEVMFFINCEDVFMGHLTKEQTKPWLEMIARHAHTLKKAGVDFSINPWTTLSHADRGRVMNPEHDFQTMVDIDGTKSSITGCPLDEKFIDYLCDIYGYIASLKPKVIWVEDDFRLHNHQPVKWGCACPLHLAEYSKRLGKEVTREEFYKGLMDKNPNEYRNVFMEVAREEMVNFAKRIGEAVRKVSPNTEVGLMSSYPVCHFIENRDWEGILHGLGAGKPPHNRPHLPAYCDHNPVSYLGLFQNVSVKTANMVPKDAKLFPELENSPWTSYSKSDAFAKFQLELCSLLGAKGITMNVFEMNGNGINPTENFDLTLKEVKPYMSKVTELGLHQDNVKGVVSLYCEDSVKTLIADDTQNLNKLMPQEDMWAAVLPIFGISTTVSNSISHKGKIVAVCGQYFRNFGKEEILELFKNNLVMLDGESIVCLCEMGLGHLAGVKAYEYMKAESGINSYEEICDGNLYAGHTKGRMSCQQQKGKFLKLDCEEDIHRISNIMSFDKTVTCPGMYLYRNCFVIPYVFDLFNFPYSFFNNVRRDAVATLLKEQGVTVTNGNAGLAVYDFGDAFMIANASLDSQTGVTVTSPYYKDKKVYEITRKGRTKYTGKADKDGVVLLKGTTKALSTRVFVIK